VHREGKTNELRKDLLDQVLMIFLLCVWIACSTFSERWPSTNGPFLTDRGKIILLFSYAKHVYTGFFFKVITFFF